MNTVPSWLEIVRAAKLNAARVFVTPGEARVPVDDDPLGTGIPS